MFYLQLLTFSKTHKTPQNPLEGSIDKTKCIMCASPHESFAVTNPARAETFLSLERIAFVLFTGQIQTFSTVSRTKHKSRELVSV